MTRGPGCSDRSGSAWPTGTGSTCARAGSGEKLRRKFTRPQACWTCGGLTTLIPAFHAAHSRRFAFCLWPTITGYVVV